MRRYVIALVAAGCLLAVAGCASDGPQVDLPSRPAPPQETTLDWVERTPASGAGLTFRVRSFRVTETGWVATIGLDNRTSVTWNVAKAIDGQKLVPGSQFGAVVLPTGELADLDEADRSGNVPPVRVAARFSPALPATLAPGALWDGTMEARGRLPAGLWVRIAFGPLTTEGTPPDGLEAGFVWYTDHAVQLRG